MCEMRHILHALQLVAFISIEKCTKPLYLLLWRKTLYRCHMFHETVTFLLSADLTVLFAVDCRQKCLHQAWTHSCIPQTRCGMKEKKVQ